MANQNSKRGKDPYVNHILEKLGERIKAFRKDKGYTNYEKFANAKNLSRSQVGRYEKGEDFYMSSLIKVLQALDIPLSEFFNEDFEKDDSKQ